jgi:hypothetical protein
MGINEFKLKYGERVLILTVNEIVKAGLDRVKAYKDSGRAMDITIAAVASEIEAQAWNDVRAIIKRCL